MSLTEGGKLWKNPKTSEICIQGSVLNNSLYKFHLNLSYYAPLKGRKTTFGSDVTDLDQNL